MIISIAKYTAGRRARTWQSASCLHRIQSARFGRVRHHLPCRTYPPRLAARHQRIPARQRRAHRRARRPSQKQQRSGNLQLGLNGFFNEAKLLYGLNHPNIVKVTDLFEANGTAYFVMPYLRGITLHQWIKNHPRPSEFELNSIFIPPVRGAQIHSRTAVAAPRHQARKHLYHRKPNPRAD